MVSGQHSPYNPPISLPRAPWRATNRAHVLALRGGTIHRTFCTAPLSAASSTPPRGEDFLDCHILRNHPLELGPRHSPRRVTDSCQGNNLPLAADIGRQDNGPDSGGRAAPKDPSLHKGHYLCPTPDFSPSGPTTTPSITISFIILDSSNPFSQAELHVGYLFLDWTRMARKRTCL